MIKSCQELACNDKFESGSMNWGEELTLDNFEKFMDRVFEGIREKRLELGVSQGELSVRMGKPQSSIARLESGGVRDPRISMFYQAAKALGVNPAEILGWAFDQAESQSVGQDPEKDWRIQKIKNRLDLLDREKKDQVAEIIERILKLLERTDKTDK